MQRDAASQQPIVARYLSRARICVQGVGGISVYFFISRDAIRLIILFLSRVRF